MPIALEHAFEEKSTKLLILPSLRTIYNRTFQCETPCIRVMISNLSIDMFLTYNNDMINRLKVIVGPHFLHYDLTG